MAQFLLNPIRVLSFVIVVATVHSAHADFVPELYEARYTSTAPSINGVLDDAAWASADLISPFYAYQSGGDPPAADTSLRILWDDNYLYVGMEADDADIRSSCVLNGACGHDAPLYTGDVLELLLRETTESTRYHEFQWSPLGEDFDARFETRFGSPGTSWESGLVSAVTVNGTADNAADTDTGWSIEARIPLVAFEAAAVTVGTEWTFTGSRYDYFNALTGSTELMMSAAGDPDAPNGGVTNGFHTYEIYDRLVFSYDGSSLVGDLNLDGILDQDDVDLFVLGWAANTTGLSIEEGLELGDINADGTTDFLDFYLLRDSFLASGMTLAGLSFGVPEPSTALLLIMGSFTLTKLTPRRRRIWTHSYSD